MEFSELGRQRVSETTAVIVGSRDSPIEVLAAAFEKPHARTGPDSAAGGRGCAAWLPGDRSSAGAPQLTDERVEVVA